VRIGAAPPDNASVGDRWFDVCEVAMMIHAGRSWLAMRPTARWQMRGFLAVAARTNAIVQPWCVSASVTHRVGSA